MIHIYIYTLKMGGQHPLKGGITPLPPPDQGGPGRAGRPGLAGQAGSGQGGPG